MIKIDIPEIQLKSGEKIPRLIHYCWFGRRPLPSLARKCLKSWKRYLPDYKIILWDENTFDITNHPYAKEAYDTKKWAFTTDYIRLYVLYHFGGIYMDTDVEVIKPLNRFLRDPAFTCFEPPNYIYPDQIVIQTGMIGAEKGNLWIKEMLNYYEDKRFLDKNGVPDLTPNPIPLTDITIKEFGLILNQSSQMLMNSVVIYTQEYFCPINWKDRKIRKTKNTYAIHYFSGSWISDNKSGEYIKVRKRVGLLLKSILGENKYNIIANALWRKFFKLGKNKYSL
jgi:mannosyltransferase OCH1-like enzyme